MNMIALNNIGFLKREENFCFDVKNNNQKESFEDYINYAKNDKRDKEISEKVSNKEDAKKFAENEKPTQKRKRHTVDDVKQKNENKEFVDIKDDKNITPTNSISVVRENEETTELSENAEKLNTETIKKLSSILEISEKLTTELLSELNLAPIDLTKSENLNKFVQVVYQVKESDKLLNIPSIVETFKNIDNMLKKAEDAEKNFSKPLDNFEEIENVEVVETKELQKYVKDNVANLHQQAEVEIFKNAKVAENLIATNQMDKPSFNFFDTNSFTNNGDLSTEIEVTLNPLNEEIMRNVEGNEMVQKVEGNEMMQNGNGKNDDSFTQSEFKMGEIKFKENPSDLINSAQNIFSKSIQHAQSNIRNIAASNINTADVVNQIIENMKVQITGNTHEVKMTLYPEQLGDVSLKISSENGIITASFTTDNQKVKEIIESNFNQLRENFKEQGIEISELSVFINQDNSQNNNQNIFEKQNVLNRMNKIKSEMKVIEEITQTETDNQSLNTLISSNVDFKA